MKDLREWRVSNCKDAFTQHEGINMNDNNSNRTLGSYFPTQQQNYSSQQGSEMISKNTFDTIFSINLVHRFPNVSNWQQFDPQTVRTVAQFSLPCSVIAQEVWDSYLSQYSQETQQQQQQQVGPFKAYNPKQRTA